MIFYEIELTGAPQILFACSVEYEKYQNEFHNTKDYLEISVCEKGRVLRRYSSGDSEITEPHTLITIAEDIDCKMYAYQNERQAHTTVGVKVSYTYKRHDSFSEVDLEELLSRLKRNLVALVPACYDAAEAYDDFIATIKRILNLNVNEDMKSLVFADDVFFDEDGEYIIEEEEIFVEEDVIVDVDEFGNEKDLEQ